MQKIDTCVLCKSEGAVGGLVLPYLETGWAHIECIENKVCVLTQVVKKH